MTRPFIAILGRQPELGLVELESVLGAEALEPFGRAQALLQTAPEIDRLGGTIKLGRILYDGAPEPLASLPLPWDELPPAGDTKIIFGLSYYGRRVDPHEVTKTGIALKKQLRGVRSIRFVAPTTGPVLSAAQLLHNRIVEHGFELLVVREDNRLIVAQTVAVQDIESYTERDYGRPVRNAKVGMLPPKLAQILINTTHAPAVVDPFCGSGVVLQEALLLGRRVQGSDAAEAMVAATQANLEWLAEDHQLPEWSVALGDARQVKLMEGSAVVTEGYLGRPQTNIPSPDQLRKLRGELETFYHEVLAAWAKQLPSGAELSLCLPSWKQDKGWADLKVIDELSGLGYTIKKFRHVDTGQLRYARPDQIVGRRIVLLKRI